MSEQMDALQRRISGLEQRLVLLAMCCAGLGIYLALFASGSVLKGATQPQMLTVKRLAVVDEKGTERVVIAAPLPDPIIQGKRVKRDGPASGILIFDPKGNERGGYVTSDTVQPLSDPLQVMSALQMAALFQLVLFAVYAVRAHWGETGVLFSGAILGLTGDKIFVNLCLYFDPSKILCCLEFAGSERDHKSP